MAKPIPSSKAASDGAHSGSRFPIVGIGASAGGLEAFTQLLKHLAPDTGMGFVLVQHLDPERDSSLTQLLSRATQMPVHEISNNMPVKPNHVYVIPPNVNLSISLGLLKIQRRQKDRTPHHSIDTFFESLAGDQRECAVGIILSGTASDGTAGLEAIKAEGGITFAQDDSAKYNSMPRTAATSGCVDLVLSPEDIAMELARISKHSYLRERIDDAMESPTARGSKLSSKSPGAPATDGEKVRSAFKRILLLLRQYSGIDFSFYKSNTIHRRIARRMLLNKVAGLAAYASYLHEKPKEVEALYSDLLINVTTFFRNPDAFEVLKRKVFAHLIPRLDDKPLRVWVAGCSTGQEAYSIAMSFVESIDRTANQPRFQIFATDLNEVPLVKARAGLFDKSLVKDISPERLRRFFMQEEGGYRVAKFLRDMIVFAKQNVLSDPPFMRMDLISCRNLLIYLDTDLQRKLLPIFHYALKPDGFLFLGESESAGAVPELFEVMDKKCKLFRRMPGSPTHLAFAARQSGERKDLTPAKVESVPPSIPTEANAQREADRMTLQRFAPPSVLVNSQLQVVQFRGDTNPFLRPASGHASFHVLKMAREGLMLPLRAALKKAVTEKNIVRKEGITATQERGTRKVNFEVVPLTHLKERCCLIFFELSRPWAEKPTQPARPGKTRATAEEKSRVPELERELVETRDYLQSIQEQYEATTEELQASNEEVTSANEELQSINEELETSKEELESTNEELITLNDELGHRNEDLRRSNADLHNLQASIKMAVLVLTRDLLIRRFTPEAEKLFNISIHDLGHSVIHIRHNLEVPDLAALLRKVISSRHEHECEVQDRQGRWFSLRVRPYLVDNKVDGAALLAVDIESVKRNEREKALAREYAEAILRTTRYPLVVLARNLRIHTANAPFYEMFNLTSEEAVGKLIYEIGHHELNDPHLRSLLEDILPRNSFFENFELTVDFEKLGLRTLLLNGRQLEETRDEIPERILLAIDDITEGKQLENLRLSELRYRRLFEASKDGVLLIDFDTRRITAANPYMTELLGYSREEFVEHELCDIGIIPDRGDCEAVFNELREKGAYHNDHLRCRSKSGAECILEIVCNLYEELGRQVVQCNIRDVTERKTAEDERLGRTRQQHELYRFASALNLATTSDALCAAALEAILGCLDAQRAAVLLMDERRSMRFKAWRALSDEYRAAADGHSPWPPDAQDPQVTYISDVGAEGGLKPELRAAIQKEGICAMSFVPLVYHKRLIGKFMVYYDKPHRFTQEELQLAETISNQLAFGLERLWSEEAERRANERLANQAVELERLVNERTASLRETVAELESFSYSIAHDLRSPLRAIQSFTELLIAACGENAGPDAKDYAQRITSAADRMDKLIQDVLSYGRVVRAEVPLKPVDAKVLLGGILESYPQLQSAATTVLVEGDFPLVRANEALLTQCLSNLLSNAVKFVAPGVSPRVRVWAESRDGRVRILFADNGIGIAREFQHKIFEIFQRLSRSYEGTGIGLAIVKKAVERMGGSVGVDSEPEKGSTFWLELDRATEENA